MNFSKLEKSITGAVKEQQIKLGYRSEKVRLYYPLTSLNRLLGKECSIEQMQEYLKECPGTDRGKILKILAELTKRTGFESALSTIDQAIAYRVMDADSLQNLYRRLYADVPELPPITMHSEIPQLQQMSADLAAYDRCLLGGGVASNG